MAAFQPLKKSSLTPKQEAYVRANYNRMTPKEMSLNIKVHVVKLRRNMEFLGLITIVRGAVKTKVLEPTFNKKFLAWIIMPGKHQQFKTNQQCQQ